MNRKKFKKCIFATTYLHIYLLLRQNFGKFCSQKLFFLHRKGICLTKSKLNSSILRCDHLIAIEKTSFSTLLLPVDSHCLISWQTKDISNNTCIDAPSTLATQATLSRKVTVTGTATKKPLKKALRYFFPKPWACAIIWKIRNKWKKKKKL